MHCYLLGITKVDPVKWGLNFKIFSPSKLDLNNMFDIDMDVPKRYLVISYLATKYTGKVALLPLNSFLLSKVQLMKC